MDFSISEHSKCTAHIKHSNKSKVIRATGLKLALAVSCWTTRPMCFLCHLRFWIKYFCIPKRKWIGFMFKKNFRDLHASVLSQYELQRNTFKLSHGSIYCCCFSFKNIFKQHCDQKGQCVSDLLKIYNTRTMIMFLHSHTLTQTASAGVRNYLPCGPTRFQ